MKKTIFNFGFFLLFTFIGIISFSPESTFAMSEVVMDLPSEHTCYDAYQPGDKVLIVNCNECTAAKCDWGRHRSKCTRE